MMDTKKLVVGQKVWMVAGPRLSEVFPGGSSELFSLRSDVKPAKVVKVTPSEVIVQLALFEGPIRPEGPELIRFDTKGKAIWSGDIYEGNWVCSGVPGSPENGPWELVDTEPYFDWTPTPTPKYTRFQTLVGWVWRRWAKWMYNI
jgi:hypothetical protein